MYEYITGTLAELTPTQAVVETGGVGYLLFISLETFSQIEHSERVKLYVHQVVREDAQLLYGFASKPNASFSGSSSAFRGWAATPRA